MEYVGELLDYKEFVRRTRQYAKQGLKHHYFMALNADEVIDATLRGSISRFMNHSCDPNCETQKVCNKVFVLNDCKENYCLCYILAKKLEIICEKLGKKYFK